MKKLNYKYDFKNLSSAQKSRNGFMFSDLCQLHRWNPRMIERGTKRNQPWVPTMSDQLMRFIAFYDLFALKH